MHRKAVKEQLKSLGVNDQIKSLVAEKRGHTQVKGKETGITKEQAVAELKVHNNAGLPLALFMQATLCTAIIISCLQGRGVIDQLVKSLSQSDIVEGGSKRQPQAVPRYV